jgi:DNA-binding protein H-NS
MIFKGCAAMEIDVNSMSLRDLKELHAKTARAIASFEERRKKEAIRELDEKARELGFSLEELIGVNPARKRSSAAPKYANPANSAETWTGRGRKPRWFEAAIADGKTAADLEI